MKQQPIVVRIEKRGFFENALINFGKTLFTFAVIIAAFIAIYWGTKDVLNKPTKPTEPDKQNESR